MKPTTGLSKALAIAAAIFTGGAATPAVALLAGNPVAVTFLYPTIDTVSAGPFGIVPEDTVTRSFIIVRISDKFIDISAPGFGAGTFINMADFNGVQVHDIYGRIDAFTDVRLAPQNTLQTFNPSRISFGADDIWLNLQGTFFGGDDHLVVAINSAGSVPEPASWAMLIAGFGLVGAMQRRRRPASLAVGASAHCIANS